MDTARLAGPLLDAVVQLREAHDAAAVDRTTAALLRRAIPADDVMRTDVDLSGQCRVRRGDGLAPDPVTSESLSHWAGCHPAVASYLEPGDDGRPRRVSDVVSPSRWTSSGVYAEVFEPLGARFQLSLVVRLSPLRGTGWVLSRSTRDFSDDERELATVLLPQVLALGRLAESMPQRPEPNDQARTPVEASPLTTAEHRVLVEVATGATTRAIARGLGLSEGTVRKHLEHVYAKLDVHDRVSAVNVLRERWAAT